MMMSSFIDPLQAWEVRRSEKPGARRASAAFTTTHRHAVPCASGGDMEFAARGCNCDACDACAESAEASGAAPVNAAAANEGPRVLCRPRPALLDSRQHNYGGVHATTPTCA